MKTGFVIMEKDFAYDDNYYFDEGHASPYRIIFNLEEAKETQAKLELAKFKELLCLTTTEYHLYNSIFDYRLDELWTEDGKHNDFCHKFFNLDANSLMKALDTEIRTLQEYGRNSKFGGTGHTRSSPDTPILQKIKSLSDQELLEFKSFFNEFNFYEIAEVEIQHVLA